MSALRCALLMVSRCLHGVEAVPRWCLGGVFNGFHADIRCSLFLGRILVASCWWCRGGCVGGPWLCLCGVSLRVAQILSVFSRLVAPCSR